MVTGNESFVVKYDALVDAVEYKVRYVDSQSGEDVAPPVITQGNAGQTYTYYSQQIANYSCDTASQSLTLTGNSGDNVITFEYTSTLEPEVNRVEIPGDTITQTERIPGTTTIVEQTTGTTTGTSNGTGAGTNTAGTADNGTAGDTGVGETETIEGEDVPLGQNELDGEEAEAGADDSETEEIEEEAVPMGQKDVEEGGSALPWVAGGVVVVAVGAGAGWYFMKKRRA